MSIKKTGGEKSFTLAEVLVVVAIIALLMGLIIINVRSSTQKAREAKALEFSHSIKMGLSSDLVGNWNFDDGSGTVAEDSSGHGNNGTLLPLGAEPDWIDGIVREALSFNFDDANFVSITKQDIFNITNQITMAAWVRTTDDIGGIFGTMNPTSPFNGYMLIVGADASGRASYWPGNFPAFSWAFSDSTVNDGNWHHIVVTHSGTSATFYIDGNEDGTTTGIGARQNNSSSGTPLIIGRLPFAGAASINGDIDEIFLYRKALSTKEIKQLYAEGKDRHLADKK